MLILQLALGAALVAFAVGGLPFARPVDGGGAPRGRPPAPPVPRVDRFAARRAYAEVRYEVSLGPRPAGSSASRRLAAHLRRLLPDGAYEPVAGGLRNVVGRLPGRRPAVLIGAHYDTKDIPGFVGANDGAAGTAAVVELARALSRGRRPGAPEVRFVLFDGEESPAGTPDRDFADAGLRGSRAYVRAHRREVGRVIVLDLIGQRGLALARERGSDPGLWSRLRAAAGRAGVVRAFPSRSQPRIYDDHTPFAAVGIPAVDLIDFDYPPFHTPADRLDRISAASLDVVGEAVVELVRGL
ncbi:MAG TPA: M28 family metallopeptidase [Solirubrobacteraceae bacterium]|nr:M28 family metallopeptidase [Solirubrobacteraceae bacterium]